MKRVLNVECVCCGFLLGEDHFAWYKSFNHGAFRRGICRDCEAEGKGSVAETLSDPSTFVAAPVIRPPKTEPVQLSFL